MTSVKQQPAADTTGVAPILELTDLTATFATSEGPVQVIRGVSLTIGRGATVGIVGESGSGKTVTMLSVMGLLPGGSRTTVGGSARLDGTELLSLSNKELAKLRGSTIAMVFQDAALSLNPVLTVGRQLREPLRKHLGLTPRQASLRAVELIEMVDIPSPVEQLDRYPHQFSGGMRQRLMIAMALACHPQVLIADEPTTALDVTVQAGIIELVKRLRAELDMAVVWITHDLSLLAGLVDQVVVMYAGRIVETADVDELFSAPRHPYTQGLLASMLSENSPRRSHLASIDGLPPNPAQPQPGCCFAPRCAFAQAQCFTSEPPLAEISPGHHAACWVLPTPGKGRA
jgi:oligopeptide transport system ATP-binding protein